MESVVNTEQKINQIKSIVEDILQGSFGLDGITTAADFQGRLSVFPNKVDSSIDSRALYGMCGTLAYELKKKLVEKGLKADTVTSSAKDNNAHVYLIIDDILIDPSIGQFIHGHNHVFVGTRAQLRNIVLNQTGEGKPYKIVNTRSKDNPQEAFERIWGNESVVR